MKNKEIRFTHMNFFEIFLRGMVYRKPFCSKLTGAPDR